MTAVRVIESSGSIGVLQSANAFGGFEPTNILFSTGSGLIEGSLKLGTDTALLISGSKDSIGTSTVGVTVFTGDVVISGTLAGGSPLKIAGGMEVTGTMEMKPAAGGSTSIIQNPVGDLKVYARENLKLGSGDGEITLIDLSGGTCGSIQLVGNDVGALKTVSLGTPGTLFFTGSGSGHYFKGQASFDNGLSGSLTRLVGGTSYLAAGANVTITSGSTGQVTIASTGGGAVSAVANGSNNRVATFSSADALNGEANLTFDGTDLTLAGNANFSEYIYHAGDTDTFIRFSDDEINFQAGAKQMIKLSRAGTNKVILNNGQADVDLQIKSKGNANVFRTDAFNNSVYFGNNGGAGVDNSFWVSGSIGSKGTSTRGTAVFGGDIVTSGSVYILNGISGSITNLSDGTSYIKHSGNIAVTSQSNGAITISSPNYVFNEYLGAADGTNTLFTLDKTPTASKNIAVFVNGMMQAPATSITSAPFQDYSVTGSSVFFTSSSIPEEGSLLFANYTTNDSTS